MRAEGSVTQRHPGRTGAKLPSLLELRSLRARLAAKPAAALADLWPKLTPFERIVRFKLLEPDRALRFFPHLPLDEQLLLIEAAPLESVAPILEAEPASRAEFHELKPWHVDEMYLIMQRTAKKP